ncbi:hypothetical protein H6S82_10615 [Planktothrix sp. FACHB-1355]|uniref:hypothetical protein n=1 Tax=Oscillatoriophycideae TaxID=1301283 RepID=UPI00168BCEAA|nr:MULTISPECIES: hypothetical protein [Oscillatoriales]MBD3559313.1 hypothetical protein [Planktothrix sp. FACHB-1355]
MYKYLQNRFRKNLIITPITKKDAQTKFYLVKDPTSGETFEFGEEEYFLCQAMNGTSTPSQILSAFKSRFELSMNEEEFNQFSEQIARFGLLESLNEQAILNPEISKKNRYGRHKIKKKILVPNVK